MLGACACSECATGSESHTFHITLYRRYIKNPFRQSDTSIRNCGVFCCTWWSLSASISFRCHRCFEYICWTTWKALMKESMPMSGIYIGKKRQKIFGDGSAARSLYRCAKPRTQQRCQAVHNLSNATVRKKRGQVVALACDTPGMKAVWSLRFKWKNDTSSWNSQMTISNRFQYFFRYLAQSDN